MQFLFNWNYRLQTAWVNLLPGMLQNGDMHMMLVTGKQTDLPSLVRKYRGVIYIKYCRLVYPFFARVKIRNTSIQKHQSDPCKLHCLKNEVKTGYTWLFMLSYLEKRQINDRLALLNNILFFYFVLNILLLYRIFEYALCFIGTL